MAGFFPVFTNYGGSEEGCREPHFTGAGLGLSPNQNQMKSKCGQEKNNETTRYWDARTKNNNNELKKKYSLILRKEKKKRKRRTNFQWAGIPLTVPG